MATAVAAPPVEGGPTNGAPIAGVSGANAAAVAAGPKVPTPARLLELQGYSSLVSADNSTSLFAIDSKAMASLQSFDSVTKANHEEFLTMIRLRETEKDAEWNIVITDRSMYKFEVGAALHTPRKRKMFIDFHSVAVDSSNPLVFSTRIYKDTVRRGLFGIFSGSADSTLQVRHYVCQSELQRDQIAWMLARLVRNEWQAMMEATVIPEPNFYQLHAHVMKVKDSRKQERVVVLSDAFIYNVEMAHGPMRVKETKWGMPLSCLIAISVEPDCEVRLFFDVELLKRYTKEHKEAKIKESSDYLYQFRDDTARLAFIEVLRFAHHRATEGGHVNVITRLKGAETKVQMPPIPIAFAHAKSTEAKAAAAAMQALAGLISSSAGDSSAAAAAAGGAGDASPIPSQTIVGNRHSLDKTSGFNAEAYETAETKTAAGAAGMVMHGSGMANIPASLADPTKPLIVEPLVKIVKGLTTSSHTKTFALFSDCNIRWGDSATKFKHSAQILGITAATDILSTLPPEKQLRFFAVRTTEKPLWLIAPSIDSKRTWISFVESLLAPVARVPVTVAAAAAALAAANGGAAPAAAGGAAAAGAIAAAVSGASSSAAAAAGAGPSNEASPTSAGAPAFGLSAAIGLESVLIKGPMTKYIKGGKDSHVKFFCAYSNRIIKWGDSEKQLKHQATIVDIDQDISELGDKISREDSMRFIRIKTDHSDKGDLELLTANMESADKWMSVISRLLGRDEDYDDQDDD